MQLDRDGIVSIALGLLLVIGCLGVEYYFTKDIFVALASLLKDLILGCITGVGILLVVVGILFIVAW